jgi:hypothetical protein
VPCLPSKAATRWRGTGRLLKHGGSGARQNFGKLRRKRLAGMRHARISAYLFRTARRDTARAAQTGVVDEMTAWFTQHLINATLLGWTRPAGRRQTWEHHPGKTVIF